MPAQAKFTPLKEGAGDILTNIRAGTGVPLSLWSWSLPKLKKPTEVSDVAP